MAAATQKKTATTAAKPAAKAQSAAPIASAFKLEGGIAVPPRSRLGGVSPYPFAQMTVAPADGSTFQVSHGMDAALYNTPDEAKQAQTEEARKIANRLSGATRRFTKQNKGFKFAVRTVDGGVRVWRIE